jgi:hypothetical protein
VAARNAEGVGLWITDGQGGGQRVTGLSGTHGWTPLSVELIVHFGAPRLSYRVGLTGAGDMWVYDPRLEVIEKPAARRTGSEADPPANGRAAH